ncbi:hypothetical protein H8356DRAFT_100486 [Neocallimastix lanati (nom. inval.)]|nr:hypothetical protein H8356DRAFT_100486 [Neocallimastix sp. JGI-2020a]
MIYILFIMESLSTFLFFLFITKYHSKIIIYYLQFFILIVDNFTSTFIYLFLIPIY